MKKRVLEGGLLGRDEALEIYGQPLEALCAGADEIRWAFCGAAFDMCTIINGKSGRCTEDCKYCAQSIYYRAELDEYPLQGADALLRQMKENAQRGVSRCAIVTSGRKLEGMELEKACASIRAIREQVGIQVCVSFGLLDEGAFRKVKAAGASRVHCNLESSRAYFKSICTTHTYEEKIETLKAAGRAGLGVCSGGIMGLGEDAADRVDMALALRELGIKSVPVNFLTPIPGTPYEKNPLLGDEEKRRIIAVYRFILPDAFIRLAGGRGLIKDRGEGCFRAGANAAISGDMLTTAGITVETDKRMLAELGYEEIF